MRYRPNQPEIKERIVQELPRVAHNLLAITGLVETDVLPKNLGISTDPIQNRDVIPTTILQRLEWAHNMGKVTWFSGSSYTDTMRSACYMTLRGLLETRDALEDDRTKIHSNLHGSLLVATRGIIAHTPYPRAFVSNHYKPESISSIQDYIRTYPDNYLELIPFMEGAQQRITNRALNTH